MTDNALQDSKIWLCSRFVFVREGSMTRILIFVEGRKARAVRIEQQVWFLDFTKLFSEIFLIRDVSIINLRELTNTLCWIFRPETIISNDR